MEHAIYPYAKAALHLYGIYHIQNLIDLWKHYESKELYRKEVLDLLADGIETDDELKLVGSYIYDPSVFDHFDQALGLYKKNKGKPFYYPSLEEFSRYVDQGYIEIKDSHKQLAQFLKQYSSTSEKEITKMIRKAVRKIQGDAQMQEIMDEFLILGNLNQDTLSEFGGILMQVMNETRRFANHGFTPNELHVLLSRNQSSL